MRELVRAVERVWSETRHSADGVVLAVDELDRMTGRSDPHVATLLKFTADELAARGLVNSMLLCAGLPEVIAQMRAEHGSAPRIFEVLVVPPLSADDVADLIDTALLGTGVTIEEGASRHIAALSGGSPDKVQALAEAAYNLVGEDRITVAIVDAAQERVTATGVFQPHELELP